MAGFIWGGNTGIATPEELANRRRWAQAMIQIGTEKTPQDPWEGLASIAHAVSGNYADYKAGQEETKQRGAASDRFNALFQSSAEPAETPVSYSPQEQTGAPGYRAIAKVMPPQNETGTWLNKQLAGDPDLRLTPAAAAGITGNFDAETGGFKHMQEIKPLIPGSRGGYGWAQWTGPRRVQFEAWTKQNGLDPASKEANYGFFKHEMMNTPEGKVLASLQGVEDPGQAASIFSDQYFRPGIPHMDRRVSAAQAYVGGSPSIQSAGDNQPVRLAQAGGPSLNELLQAYSDPWTSPEQRSVLQVYIQREMDKADPRNQLEMKKLEAEVGKLTNPQPEMIYDTREYEQAKKQGYDGSLIDFMTDVKRAGATSINLPGQPNIGAIPEGWQATQDPVTDVWSMRPIAGGPAAAEAAATKKVAENRKQGEVQRGDLIIQEIDRALGVMDTGVLPDTGWGSLLSSVPGTDAKALSSFLETVKANIGFGELNKMRQQSPTGGALGQVTERELAVLQSVAGSLDQSQSADQLKDNLNRLWNAYQDVVHGQGKGPERRMLSFDKSPQQTGAGAVDAEGWTSLPGGVRIREKK